VALGIKKLLTSLKITNKMNKPLLVDEPVTIISFDRKSVSQATILEMENYIEYFDKDDILAEDLYMISWVKECIDRLVINGEDIPKDVLFQIDQMNQTAIDNNANYIRFVN
jgi:hypothetical protein